MHNEIRLGKHAEWQETSTDFWTCACLLVVQLMISKKTDGTYTADAVRMGNLPTPQSQLERFTTFEDAEESLFVDAV